MHLSPSYNFNSIKVRLEPSIFIDAEKNRLDFNSIKVRLEQKAAKSEKTAESDFNSIKVRLEQCAGKLKTTCRNHFNSIKVRLEPRQFSRQSTAQPFQFHKGAIRTPARLVLFPSSRISIP